MMMITLQLVKEQLKRLSKFQAGVELSTSITPLDALTFCQQEFLVIARCYEGHRFDSYVRNAEVFSLLSSPFAKQRRVVESLNHHTIQSLT